MMDVTYIYWGFMIAVGLFAGMRASAESWRPIFILDLSGLVFIGVAVLIGLEEGLDLSSLKALFSFDGNIWPKYSTAYRIAGVGFVFISAGTVMSAKKIYRELKGRGSR